MMLKETLIVLLFFIANSAFSQPELGLDDLLKIAEENNPDVVQQNYLIQQWEIKKEKVYHFGTTQFSLQAGQNDGEDLDLFFNINQPIGRPWTIGGKKDYSQTNIDYETAKLFSIKKQINYQIKSAYLAFHFHKTVSEMIERLEPDLKSAYSQSKTLLDKQSITFAEFIYFEQFLNNLIYLKQSHIKQQLEQGNSLTNFVNQTEIKILTDTVFNKFQYDINAPDTTLLLPFKRQIEMSETETKVIKGNYSPALQVGYFHQTLQNVFGFQGATFGVNIPMFYSQKRQDLKLNEIRRQSYSQDFQTQKNNIESALKNCYSYFNEVDSISGLHHHLEWSKAMKELYLKKESGEISHLEFVQFYQTIIQGKLKELEHIFEYNQMVLKYEFLSL